MSTNNSNSPSAAQLASGLIISAKEAKKLLGVAHKELADDEVAGLTLDLHELARTLLQINR